LRFEIVSYTFAAMKKKSNKVGRPKEKPEGLVWKNIELPREVIDTLDLAAKETPMKNSKRYIEKLCNDRAKKLSK
jgi:hypothetical protein